MGKSQQTWNKNEREKKRLKKREEKRKKMEARKLEAKEHGKKGIEFAYVDHNGQLTDTPPDPADKVVVDIEDIDISVPKTVHEEIDPIRKGTVEFFDATKGFGFIVDSETQEKHFVHKSGLIDSISEQKKVSFELEKGLKGMNAVNVKLV
ncbi:cold shock domain-containing protein [Urechidicola sp. KH5]